MNKYYAIDIETMPNEDILDKVPDKQKGKEALSPLYGKIACIGIYGSDGTKKCLFGTEKDMIKDLFEILSYRNKVITYNGKGFDFPFIFKRAAILGVKPLYQMDQWTNRFKAMNHIDVMAEWCDFGKYEKLDTLADIILGYGKIEFDVTTIKDLIKTEGGRKTIEKYCIRDCEITYKLAEKFGYITY